VDRLTAVITGDSARKDATVTHAWSRRWLIAGALLVVAAIAVFTLMRGGFGSSGASIHVAPVAPTDASWASPGGQPYGIALPRLVEVVHNSLIYTMLSASVTPIDNSSSELRVRVRFTNDGRYDANAWDNSFRLVAGSTTFAPTSGLNEIAHGHTSTQGIVTFRVPSGTGKAVLQVIEGDRIAELLLDLSRTTLLVQDEHADAGDALSRGISATITGAPRLLVRDGDLSVTIERATARRFVNAVRLRIAVRFANRGRYPAGSGDAVIRLAVGDEVRAPIEAPGLVIEPNSNAAADVEFEAPPATTRAVLRGTIRSTSGEWPFELRQDTVD
jgi:hypothetical protein